jgi:hypothetical protein
MTTNEWKKSDKTRGKLLFIGFSTLLLISVVVYLVLHVTNRTGLASIEDLPGTAGLSVVAEANSLLSGAKTQLTVPEKARLLVLTKGISALEPELSAREAISGMLLAINTELEKDVVEKPELVRQFATLEEQIRLDSTQVPSASRFGFWSEGADRWIEVAFWSLFGTLVFLLSEIKYWSCRQRCNYTKYTLWYFANLLRGPFVSMLILFALSSIAITIVGLELDVNNAPIEALIFLAAILGFYSRTATKVLDQVVAEIFPSAWEKTQPVGNVQPQSKGEDEEETSEHAVTEADNEETQLPPVAIQPG